MSTRNVAIDPELAAALSALPRASNGSLMDLTDIPALRKQLQVISEQEAAATVADPRVLVQTVAITRDDGTRLELVICRPSDGDQVRPALVWFHAGGQVLGSAHDDLAYHRSLALDLDCAVFAVDYRLAPDTPAPGAAEDGYLAFTYLHRHSADLGIDPDRIGLAGASGGGAPAAATALMLRDRRAPRPCLLSLSYAMLDDRNQTPSSHEVTDIGVWDRRENLLAWSAVLGDRAGGLDLDSYSAPGRVADLTGLPPTFVAAAQYDVFRDEDINFAQALITSGVPVDLHLYAGAFHAWDRFAPDAALTRSYEQTWHDFLRRQLHR